MSKLDIGRIEHIRTLLLDHARSITIKAWHSTNGKVSNNGEVAPYDRSGYQCKAIVYQTEETVST